MTDCIFCKIIQRTAPASIVQTWNDAIAFEPLNPVTDGHLLIVPKQHVDNFAVQPAITGMVAQRAALCARDVPGDYNLITSQGPAATQTIRHLHFHLIPRHEGDGLHLPWTNQPEAT